eukprot:1334985-Rhodomonas_salina.4
MPYLSTGHCVGYTEDVASYAISVTDMAQRVHRTVGYLPPLTLVPSFVRSSNHPLHPLLGQYARSVSDFA